MSGSTVVVKIIDLSPEEREQVDIRQIGTDDESQSRVRSDALKSGLGKSQAVESMREIIHSCIDRVLKPRDCRNSRIARADYSERSAKSKDALGRRTA